ncbi:helix-turn-helix transcriptional regulator [Bacillus sp. FJAT-27251]|uniref:helix-turn-helix domain-containing protein n=1 Tax=Bacillus sp. FJAT-27251 TaxID=1684142 RepID=UPI0006A79168|nr:helix-turn-helix transcriptional regulator [Bacillus sp. FJAT-27251]
MSDPNLGLDIKNLRTKKGIGSRELSRLVGKAETYISQLERGLIKNPDYKTLLEIMKHLGYREGSIDELLYANYHIYSPERLEAEAAWAEQEAVNAQDPDYQEYLLQRQIEQYELQLEWLENEEKELHKKNDQIRNELSFFIDKNLDTFTDVINNLHSAVLSMSKSREDYNFFTNLFKRDISKFSDESKKRIIETIKEEYKYSWDFNGGFGEPPTY